MGKKKKLKYLRKIAGELIDKSVMTSEKHFVAGQILIDQGHTDFGGQPIDPVKIYEQKMPIKMNVNHGRKMKKLYNRGGTDAVKEYLKQNKKRK